VEELLAASADGSAEGPEGEADGEFDGEGEDEGEGEAGGGVCGDAVPEGGGCGDGVEGGGLITAAAADAARAAIDGGSMMTGVEGRLGDAMTGCFCSCTSVMAPIERKGTMILTENLGLVWKVTRFSVMFISPMCATPFNHKAHEYAVRGRNAVSTRQSRVPGSGSDGDGDGVHESNRSS